MRPAPFSYHRPGTLDEAVALMAEFGSDGRVLSGGQSLIPAMTTRVVRPSAVVDIGRIEGLAALSLNGGGLRLGAGTSHAAVERSAGLRSQFPLLPEVAAQIAHPSIRTRGTIGGSLAHADPAAEWPAVILACKGRVRAHSVRGDRWIAADSLFEGYFTTSLAPDEILTEIEIPLPGPSQRYAFGEHARQKGAFATAIVVACVDLREDMRVRDLRIAVAGCGPCASCPADLAPMANGEVLSDPLIEAVAEQVSTALAPLSDIHASSQDRRQIVRVLTRRALARVAGKESR
jgi:CO/xanthine dehydrogenase FAD-binding subunit